MNMLDTYNTYFRGVYPILKDMSARGIPIDESRRLELKALIEREDLRVTAEIQAIVPEEVLSTKQKMGLKNPPLLVCEDCGQKTRTDHWCVVLQETAEELLGRAMTLEGDDRDGDIEANQKIFAILQDNTNAIKHAQAIGVLVPYADLAEEHNLVLREISVGENEKCRCSKTARGSCAVCAGSGIIPRGTMEMRWAKPVEFNPNSKLQVIRFMKHLKHPVPKHQKRVDAQGEASDTTEVKELERLYTKTKHPIYPLLIDKRQITKTMGTYVEGWKPSKDGRIHTTYSYGTATWQLAGKAPNTMNGMKRGRTQSQKDRVEAFNRMQRAEPGHILVSLDYKSFHGQTTACEAGMPDYLRLAKIDIHSFTTCHFIKHPERHGLLKLSDADLKSFFDSLKADKRIWTNGMTFKEIRNGKTKSAGLGIGFGMRHRKLYQMYKEDFESEREAETLWNLIMHELFQPLYDWQERVKKQAAEEKRLVSRFGAIRHFFDVQRFDRRTQKIVGGDQGEAAIAFLPASNAFGMIRWAMLNLREKGLDGKYELINTVHDSLTFHPLIGDVEALLAEVIPIMQAPCPMMVYPGVTGQEGLSVEVEAGVGDSMADMH